MNFCLEGRFNQIDNTLADFMGGGLLAILIKFDPTKFLLGFETLGSWWIQNKSAYGLFNPIVVILMDAENVFVPKVFFNLIFLSIIEAQMFP